MQTTTTTTTQIHVKASLDNEFRRFALNPPTFINLFTTLKTLFNIDKEFRIKFQDDEKDWVLLSTDQELLYAHELAGSPLRLDIKIVHESTATSPSDLDACRGGRGRSRGRGGRVGANLSKEERLTLKSNKLASRIAELETKINSGHLNSDRDRVLRWRLGNLQNKLKAIQLAKETLQTAPGGDMTSPSSATETHPFCNFRGGRGRGRGGRLCARMPLEVVENFHKCKSDLQVAHESGNQEQIDSCLAAFLLAKKQKQEARAKLLAEGQTTDRERRCPWGNKARIPPEIIANFRKCKFNLQVARESGNQEQIESCLAAFQLAKKQKQEARAKLVEEGQAKANLSSEEKEDQKETTPCDAPCTGTSTM